MREEGLRGGGERACEGEGACEGWSGAALGGANVFMLASRTGGEPLGRRHGTVRDRGDLLGIWEIFRMSSSQFVCMRRVGCAYSDACEWFTPPV